MAEKGCQSQTVNSIKAIGAWWRASGQISQCKYMQCSVSCIDAASGRGRSSYTGKAGALCVSCCGITAWLFHTQNRTKIKKKRIILALVI